MEIRILGTGCSKCDKLEKNTRKAIEELGYDATLESTGDLKTMVAYGVMQSPAFVVDDVVKSVGRAMSVREIKKILTSCCQSEGER